VIGGYGLIGGYVTARLVRDGHTVVGVGRDVRAARRRAPGVEWVEGDLAAAGSDTWRPVLAGAGAVVNCAGALQDGPRDHLEGAHVAGLRTLIEAGVHAGVSRFIQVSAVGVEDGPGAFSRTKREAEEVLRGSDLDWVILRPGLVLAPAAYGGSALLRALAAFPWVTPLVHPGAIVQVVSVEDVAEAVTRAARPDGPARISVDIVASRPTTLGELVACLRAWLGLAPAPVWAMPVALVGLGARVADALAWLGWQSPLRTTAIAQLARGVRGEAGQCVRELGFAQRDLETMLADWPAGVQERWFARLYFVKPLTLATLAGFWLASGLIGIARLDAAARVLTGGGLDGGAARLSVLCGGVIDIGLGLLVCFRRTARPALGGMLLVSAIYILGTTIWRPDLWADPLGPIVKVAPAAVLALAALAMMDER